MEAEGQGKIQEEGKGRNSQDHFYGSDLLDKGICLGVEDIFAAP